MHGLPALLSSSQRDAFRMVHAPEYPEPGREPNFVECPVPSETRLMRG